MPMDWRLPCALKNPVTPTTALSLSNASVVAGSSRLTLPAFNCSTSVWGSTSTLTFTAESVEGEKLFGLGRSAVVNSGELQRRSQRLPLLWPVRHDHVKKPLQWYDCQTDHNCYQQAGDFRLRSHSHPRSRDFTKSGPNRSGQ